MSFCMFPQLQWTVSPAPDGLMSSSPSTAATQALRVIGVSGGSLLQINPFKKLGQLR